MSIPVCAVRPFLRALAGLLVTGGLSGLSLPVSAAQTAPVATRTCHLPGHEMPLRCFTLDVPRDYAQATKGKLSLHVAVAPAFREGSKPDPLFVLAGGPGQSGSSLAWTLESAFLRARATRDIVLIDQRGTGKSGKLSCPDLERSEEMDPERGEQLLASCLRSIKVDLNDYSTDAAVDDLERVRLALNVAKINLWGGSYGSRLAQAYARKYPQNVRAMVIDGVVSPAQNVALMGSETGRAMKLLRQQCDQDAQCRAAFPQFGAQLDALVARAVRGNETIQFVHPVTGKKLQMPFRLDGFGEQVRAMLYMPATAVRLPWLVMQAHEGNWQPFAAMAFSGAGAEDGMAVGLQLAVLCSEDLPYMTAAQIQHDQGLSFLGDSWSRRMQRFCGMISVKPHARAQDSVIQTPTLLLSGLRDPVTPPERALEALRTLPRGQHLQAAAIGHIVTPHGCGPKLLRQFLDAPEQKLDGHCLQDLTAPSFVVSAAGAQP